MGMKTITISNIALSFDTSENGDPKLHALKMVDFLNGVLDKMKLPDNLQIVLTEEKVKVQVEDWVIKGWK